MMPTTELEAAKLSCPFMGQSEVMRDFPNEDFPDDGLVFISCQEQRKCVGSACAMWNWHQRTTGWPKGYDVPLAEPIGCCSLALPPLIQVNR